MGCSQKVVKEYVEKPVLTPDSLLVDPCEAIGAGDTVRSLAKGYISNTSCIGEYKLLLNKQRKHKVEMETIYNVPTK